VHSSIAAGAVHIRCGEASNLLKNRVFPRALAFVHCSIYVAVHKKPDYILRHTEGSDPVLSFGQPEIIPATRSRSRGLAGTKG
jgi:hypothetical protein